MATIKQTHLISIETLKSFYPIDENVEQKVIISNIQKSENFQIIPLIGRVKFDELITYIEDIKTGGTSNVLNDTLLQTYIEPVIGWFVISEVLFNNTFKTKNIGNNQGDPNAFYLVQKAAQKFRDDSENYLEILRKFLSENDIKEEETFVHKSTIFLGDTSSSDKPTIGNTTVNQYRTGLYF